MTNNDIQQLIDKYLNGETSPAEEQQLALELSQYQEIPEEWHAVRLMLGELAIGEAEYDAIIKQRSRKPSALLIALRVILSTAAIYLVGLFFWLQTEPTVKIETALILHGRYTPGNPDVLYGTTQGSTSYLSTIKTEAL